MAFQYLMGNYRKEGRLRLDIRKRFFFTVRVEPVVVDASFLETLMDRLDGARRT